MIKMIEKFVLILLIVLFQYFSIALHKWKSDHSTQMESVRSEGELSKFLVKYLLLLKSIQLIYLRKVYDLVNGIKKPIPTAMRVIALIQLLMFQLLST